MFPSRSSTRTAIAIADISVQKDASAIAGGFAVLANAASAGSETSQPVATTPAGKRKAGLPVSESSAGGTPDSAQRFRNGWSGDRQDPKEGGEGETLTGAKSATASSRARTKSRK